MSLNPPPSDDLIDATRAFNRRYTQAMGLLNPSILGSGLNLTEGRILFDLSVQGDQAARDMAARLGVDEGYVSRVLARFEARRMIVRQPDPQDRRRRRVSLTDKGRAVAAPLIAASKADVGARLASLSAGAQQQLADGMALVTSALEDRTGGDGQTRLRPLGAGDMGWLIQQHALLYAASDGFDRSFEVLVARILADFRESHNPATERGWIAEVGGRPMGSIFCMRRSETEAQLRLFLLAPEARGRGLGRTLLEACITFARRAGYRELGLWTHDSHTQACALYAAAGFEMTASEPVLHFGQNMVQQNWKLTL